MKRILSILIFLSLFSLISCSNKESNPVDVFNEIDKSQPIYSYYTGEEISQDLNNNTPFMVMVENSVYARPQSGLSYADVIYETLAEGGIPRFMALFHSKQPNAIGPIRSVRPYFLDLAHENNLAFAHCGGSSEALATISEDESIMSINEISNGKYFWRDDKRSAPHNLYTSSENILNSIIDKKFNSTPKPFATFNSEYYSKESLNTIKNINLNVNRFYNTSYIYDNGEYIKYMDGEVAIDALTDKPLSFANVVIQKTNIQLQADNNHIDIDLIGEGEGYIFSNGKYVNVLWKKEDKNSKTTFYDYSGNVVPLSQGKTIWHILDKNSNITFS
ncbi:DUF3048 domain-containing protein [Clostridium chauvoei]|uniref:Lipoprotein YerB n=2 Tax=Clostridium chauvoei TaxID=46867 RepID=A0A1U6IRX8_9CLOT|nr:DUF3048 domain-containing protein [Clostridium chauvoei]ATD53849.1 hypothetical protein BTM20_00605 [Clostridium chauvoei]ATD58347.1 hypothetical protein BTM21_11715 [Clostridium chauvoei]MBX7280391.1 DUF3048 domain-containing protein [Clostridium chauvoei]MBX7282876.1 DUF3048 domain-containing protein [Clostridium chauvoei]MBX7285282.1 DUF3048 domain-containing protein [Clostridium chauvoei]